MMFTVVAGEPTLSARPSLHASFSALSNRRVTSLLVLLWATWFAAGPLAAQTNSPSSKPSTPSRTATTPPQQEKASEVVPQVPARLELLEAHYRFEADGSSRKEVHTIVKINSELGVRQFAHLNFDYNRAFENVEIPLMRVTHSSGGTADVLPSAITDNPNPAVADAPAYQDVRVKSVRILGLEPADTLDYRVITTISHPPLAPDFWLEHSFNRTGVVLNEQFQVDLPPSVLAKVEYIVIKNEATKRNLEWRLYPDPGCGLCVEPTIRTVDPALLAQLPPLNTKKTKPEKAIAKPAEVPPPTAPP